MWSFKDTIRRDLESNVFSCSNTSYQQSEHIPFLFSSWNLAPMSSRYFTVSSLQLSMALLKGVELLMETASTKAPDLIRSSTMSCWPAWHAKWSGVHRKLSVALTLALRKKTDAYTKNMGCSKHGKLKCKDLIQFP